jgi:hypothetical protein
MDLHDWMNVNLDVYMDVLYIMWNNCASFVVPALLVILFFKEKNLTYAKLRWLGLDPHRLACFIYKSQLDRRRLTCVMYDSPAQLS